MSNVLAIAAITQLLKDLLNDALINGDASQALGADFIVTALPPDRVVAENPEQQATQLNLFLHRITPNAALRNTDLPTRDAAGRLVCRPRLALDLHYILTAVAPEELHAEILLGYAMQLFHELAILPRETIRAALASAVSGDILPDSLGVIRASALADQIEVVKITPHTLSMDDMSKMWTALQASYRTTVAYDVSLVLIERDLPTRPSLPVLSRGGLADPVTGRDPGVTLRPSLAQTAPTLLAIEPFDGQSVMRLGRDIALHGHALDIGETRVRFAETGAGVVLELAPLSPTTPTRVVVRLPAGPPLAPAHPLAGTGADPGAWRIGPYSVDVRLTEAGGRETITNALAIALAPATTPSAAPDAAGTAITMTSEPPIRPGQTVAILVGQRMEQLASPVAPADQVQAVFAGLTSGAELPVRLRVDGVDSPVIDRLADPPVLETVTIP
jgi:Pvc16 N-terminal domain